MTTYWHIAHPSYTGGDLLCRNDQATAGIETPWMWVDAEDGLDGNVVCLFPDTPRGRTEAEWLWFERRDYTLLRVDLPDDYPVTEVEEGYPAVDHSISADYITVVRTGYAAQTVTQPGDEY